MQTDRDDPRVREEFANLHIKVKDEIVLYKPSQLAQQLFARPKIVEIKQVAKVMTIVHLLLVFDVSFSSRVGGAIRTALVLLGVVSSNTPTWTTFTQTTGSIFYVSSSGNDTANNCTNINSPCLTLAHGQAQLTNGHPDWLLFKCGDTFTDQQFNTVNGLAADLNGKSSTEPMVIGSYTTTTPATVDPADCAIRPFIKVATSGGTQHDFITFEGGPAAPANGNFIAFVGLHAKAYTRDPTDSGFIPANAGNNQGGITWIANNHIDWALIEDCWLDFFTTSQTGTPADLILAGKLIINGSIISNNYVAQGFLTGGASINNFTSTFTLWYQNGWCALGAGCPSGTGRNLFNRDLYQDLNAGGNSAPANFTNNLFINSSDGVQFRPGGNVINNFWAQEPNGFYVGAFGGTVTGNVVTESPTNTGADGGVGIQVNPTYNGFNTTVSKNIVAHTANPGTGFGLSANAGAQNITFNGNVVCDWNSPMVDSATGSWAVSSVTPGAVNTYEYGPHGPNDPNGPGVWNGISVTGSGVSGAAAHFYVGSNGQLAYAVTGGQGTGVLNGTVLTGTIPAWNDSGINSVSASFTATIVNTITWTSNTFQAANCNGIGPDPANSTIEAYDASIGGPGTLAHFTAGALANSKHSWNPAYTAGAANSFIRGKLGVTYP